MSATFVDIPQSADGALLVEQELTGPEDQELDAWIDRLEAVGADVERSWFAASDADRERIRRFRHALPEQVNDIVRRNGFLKYGTDFAVPAERNREMLAFYRERLESGFRSKHVIFGHIGDAHLHVNMLPESEADAVRAKELFAEFARRAVELGGTVSAEHGLGKRKRDLLGIQYPREAIQAMRDVKSRFDPDWLLGRGTLFSPPDGSA
jgi:FAD/FMN-containing dehydrogenase